MHHDYDFVVQFRHSVVRDIHARAVNASFLTNLTFATPVSRSHRAGDPLV